MAWLGTVWGRWYGGGVRRPAHDATEAVAARGNIAATALPLPDLSGDTLPYGVWPEDSSVTPDWMTRRHARAADIGLALPAYKTRDEFDAAVRACTERLTPAQTPHAPSSAPHATGPSPHAVQPTPVIDAPAKRHEALHDMRLLLSSGALIESHQWLAARWRRSESWVSKRMADWRASGIIPEDAHIKIGKCKTVDLRTGKMIARKPRAVSRFPSEFPSREPVSERKPGSVIAKLLAA